MIETCAWFEACERTAVGYCAHPDQGVIPVCQTHIDTYRLRVITAVAQGSNR